MASVFGKRLKVSVFGESHGPAVGATADGFPSGEPIDMEALRGFCARRRPGQALSTGRSESDEPEILSGMLNGMTTGFPLSVIIRNNDTKSADYSRFVDVPRPGHADLTALFRYGDSVDLRGGGHFSGRLTAPLVALGGIARQMLERRGISVGAHLFSVWNICDSVFDPVSVDAGQITAPGMKVFPVCDDEAGEKMRQAIRSAAESRDSVGGVVECAVLGMPQGVGTPMFDRVECRLSEALFGIPAVRGVEFGEGFAAALSRGSLSNDAYCFTDGKVRTKTNRHGGLLGGITTGMPIIFRVAFKPTPSISAPQSSVDLKNGTETTLEISGRHDPCVALRAVPVVEALACLVVTDLLLSENKLG